MAGEVGFGSIRDNKKFQVLPCLLGRPSVPRGQVCDVRCVTVFLSIACLAGDQNKGFLQVRGEFYHRAPAPTMLFSICVQRVGCLHQKAQFLKTSGREQSGIIKGVERFPPTSDIIYQDIADLKCVAYRWARNEAFDGFIKGLRHEDRLSPETGREGGEQERLLVRLSSYKSDRFLVQLYNSIYSWHVEMNEVLCV